ncbi:hypothetical protein [uncultured Sphingomonas sp.]|uniref:hypothetical protein n=1 Tax=uncultured Sphingomonas sp. TaxID=158754 RepID=UPI0025889210|nr:hypothetical protein [uncultured Sphingomonas sp.]
MDATIETIKDLAKRVWKAPLTQMAVIAYGAWSTLRLSWWMVGDAFEHGDFTGYRATIVYTAPVLLSIALIRAILLKREADAMPGFWGWLARL